MSNEKKENIIITSQDNEQIEVEVLEQTTINNTNYLLVVEVDEDTNKCHILKDISSKDDEYANYVEIDDDSEFNTVSDLFGKMLKDYDITISNYN